MDMLSPIISCTGDFRPCNDGQGPVISSFCPATTEFLYRSPKTSVIDRNRVPVSTWIAFLRHGFSKTNIES